MMMQSPPILLVEDNAIIQRITASDLEWRGHEVVIAGTAAEALEELNGQKFGLILMDVGLPDGNGLDISQTIRQDNNCQNQYTPIVVVTAHSTDAVSQQRCIKLGIQALIMKPLTPEKLDQALQYFYNV
tara:strand:- start:77 stop:463 length:387 start_codon:yes stop_codon:yes gene_type:complete